MEKGNGIGMGKGSGNWSADCQSTGIGVRTVKALELEWGLSKHWNRPPKVWATPLVHFSDITWQFAR